MGWCGEIRDKLEYARDSIDQAPLHSVAWLLAVEEWNDALYELGTDYWYADYEGSFRLPKNCEIEPYNDREKYRSDALPTISCPDFDLSQPLQVKDNVE